LFQQRDIASTSRLPHGSVLCRHREVDAGSSDAFGSENWIRPLLVSEARGGLRAVHAEAPVTDPESQIGLYKTELIAIERKVEQFLDRIADADVPSVVKTYEDRIRKLEADKAAMNEKIAGCGQPARGFDEKLRTALEFLANPCKLWISERLEDRRTVLKLAFADRISYSRNQGFRTPNFSFPFRFLADVSAGRIEVASLRGESSNQLFET
jgi:hypothetical protein